MPLSEKAPEHTGVCVRHKARGPAASCSEEGSTGGRGAAVITGPVQLGVPLGGHPAHSLP